MKISITTGRIAWAVAGLLASGGLLGLASSGAGEHAASPVAPALKVELTPPADPLEEARAAILPADKVAVTAVPLSGPISVGEPHVARLRMEFSNGGSHHRGAPVRVDVRATGLVKVEAERLERGDARAPHDGDTVHELEMDVPFAAAAAGEGTLHADVEVFVCSEGSCDPVRKSVSWRIRAD